MRQNKPHFNSIVLPTHPATGRMTKNTKAQTKQHKQSSWVSSASSSKHSDTQIVPRHLALPCDASCTLQASRPGSTKAAAAAAAASPLPPSAVVPSCSEPLVVTAPSDCPASCLGNGGGSGARVSADAAGRPSSPTATTPWLAPAADVAPPIAVAPPPSVPLVSPLAWAPRAPGRAPCMCVVRGSGPSLVLAMAKGVRMPMGRGMLVVSMVAGGGGGPSQRSRLGGEQSKDKGRHPTENR